MTRPAWTDRRSRFNHLIGIDRYRIVCTYNDHSAGTESFDETTINTAKTTAAALLSPGHSLGDRPTKIEIRLGHWTSVGSNDCEWADIQPVATGHVTTAGDLIWSEPKATLPLAQGALPFSSPQTVGVGGPQ